MGSSLGDERRIHKARAALRELLGESIPLAPAASGAVLVAELTFNPKVLLRAAGSDVLSGTWVTDVPGTDPQKNRAPGRITAGPAAPAPLADARGRPAGDQMT